LAGTLAGSSGLAGLAHAQGVRAEWQEEAATANPANAGTLDYNADANWYSNDTPPTQARFGYTDNSKISFSSPATTVGEWLFKATNPSGSPTSDYTFTIGSGQSFTFQKAQKLGGAFLETGIVVNAGSVRVVNGGTLGFKDHTSADYNGSGKVVIENNGTLQFSDNADGGQARIINDGAGIFSIENLTSSGMEAGSIEGGGQFRLGDKNLTIGGNDRSTEVTGNITGDGGSLTKIGAGTLTLSGDNDYSGGTTIEGGTIQLGADGAIGSGGLDIAAGATFDMWGFNQTVTSLDGDAGGKITTSKPITLVGSPPVPVLSYSVITVNGGGDFAGVIEDGAGFMSLTKGGSGILTLSGVNDYSGTTTVNGGTLALAGDGSIESSASLYLNTNTLDISQTNDGARIRAILAFPGGGINLGAKTLTLTGENSANGSEIYSVISGDGGGLTIEGGPSVKLHGANTYTGATTIAGGTLTLSGSASIAASSTVDIEEDGIFDLTRAFDTSIKSLEGEGVVHLGGKTLTVTDAHTTFSGLITDVYLPPTGGIGSAEGKLALTGGTLTLTGENSYTGGTDIEGGTMIVGNDIALGQGTVTMAEGTTLGFAVDGLKLHNAFEIAGDPTFDVMGGFTETLSGDIGDDDPGNPGILEKTGTGTLILSGDNSYSGGTAVTAGTVVVGSDTAFGTGTVAMADGTTLGFDTGGAYDVANDFAISGTATVDVDVGLYETISGDIADGSSPGSLTKTGDGNLVLSGANTYTGATNIEDGWLLLKGDGSVADSSGVFFTGDGNDDAFDITQTDDGASIKTLSGNGLVYITGKTLTITDASTAFDGDFYGGGTLELTGGALTLNGVNYVGQTNVRNATLVVGDSTHEHAFTGIGDMDVYDGGIVAGYGEVSNLNIHANGTVAPGSPAGTIGTLTVNGDMTFDPGSTYEVDADPESTSSDLVHVTGTAHLGNAMVVHVGLAGTYDLGAQYTILTADDGLDDAFLDGVTTVSESLFVDPALSYDDNNVYLEFDRNDVAFGDFAGTRNQRAAAAGAESLGPGNPIYDVILVTTDPSALGPAFDSLSGEVHASVKGMFMDDSRFVREAAIDRIRAAFAGDGPAFAGGRDGADAGDALWASPAAAGPATWAHAFGDWGSFDGDGNAAAVSRSIGGVFFGADAPVAPNWRLGALAGYSHASIDVADRASSATSDDYHSALYGGARWGAGGLRAGAAYTHHEIDTVRNVAFPGFDDRLKGDYDAGTAQIFGEVAYDMQAGGFGLEPFANLAYVNLHTDGFSEQGGAAALSADDSDTDATFTMLGVRASGAMMLASTPAKLHAMAGWRHAFGDTTPLADLAFAGGDVFTIAGAPIAEDAAFVEAGLDLQLTPSASLGATYQGQFASNVNQNGFDARFNVQF
jgi:outer membrane autotransporter protein